MKKIVAFAVLILVFLLSGCNESSYDEYLKAKQKTEELESAKKRITLKLDNDFSQMALEEDTLKELDRFSQMEMDMDMSYHGDTVKADVYIKDRETGMDYSYYQTQGKQYLKLPVIGKYLDLGEMDFSSMGKITGEQNMTFAFDQEQVEPFVVAFQQTYQELLKTKDVSKIETLQIETEEGLVKTKRFAIVLDETTRKVFKEELKELVKTHFMKEQKSMQDEFEKMFENVTIEKFEVEAYIDYDDIIVKEKIITQVRNEVEGHIGQSQMEFEINRWEANQSFEISFPVIQEKDILKMEELKDLQQFSDAIPK